MWAYSGVRPLYDDGTAAARSVTRDYVLELDAPRNYPALLSIFGGKITTFRGLARTAVDKLAPCLPARARDTGWSRDAPLPGGDFPVDGFPALVESLAAGHPGVARRHVHGLARRYGTRAASLSPLPFLADSPVMPSQAAKNAGTSRRPRPSPLRPFWSERAFSADAMTAAFMRWRRRAGS